ncbi:MAG: hypothetical protein ABI767_06900 [Rhodanobacter sp.]
MSDRLSMSGRKGRIHKSGLSGSIEAAAEGVPWLTGEGVAYDIDNENDLQ